MDLGRKLGLDRSSIQAGKQVLKHGHRDLVSFVEQGSLAIAPAALLTKSLSKNEQVALIAKGRDAVKQHVRELRSAGQDEKSAT